MINKTELENSKNSLNQLVLRGRKFDDLSEVEQIFIIQGEEFEKIKQRNRDFIIEQNINDKKLNGILLDNEKKERDDMCSLIKIKR